MYRYAKNTTVSSEKTRGEIERTLTRYGADQFMYGWKEVSAVIAFRAHGRNIRFVLPMPAKDDKRFLRDGRGSLRSVARRAEAYEQETRRRWRALSLSIKAKLEAVHTGITQFEEEFYAHIVLPSGRTIYEETCEGVRLAYESGKTVPLLPHLT